MTRMTEKKLREDALRAIRENRVVYEVFDRYTGEDYRVITRDSMKTTDFIESVTGDPFETEEIIDKFVIESLNYRILERGTLVEDHEVPVYEIKSYRYYVKFCFYRYGGKDYLQVVIHHHS